eukprot:7882626-Prorocentrum_lima.AAC.1
MDMRTDYEDVALHFGPLPNKYIDHFRLGKKLVEQLRHATNRDIPLSQSGWMYLTDVRKISRELSLGIALRILSRQKNEDKDRFL